MKQKFQVFEQGYNNRNKPDIVGIAAILLMGLAITTIGAFTLAGVAMVITAISNDFQQAATNFVAVWLIISLIAGIYFWFNR